MNVNVSVWYDRDVTTRDIGVSVIGWQCIWYKNGTAATVFLGLCCILGFFNPFSVEIKSFQFQFLSVSTT